MKELQFSHIPNQNQILIGVKFRMSDNISIIHKALKIRLYPNEDQKILLNKTFGCCRLLYNERLAEHMEWYDQNKDKTLENL